VKGIDGARPIWPRRAGRSKRHKGSLVWIVGSETAKARIYNHLRVETPGPGYCHFSFDYTRDFFKQLTAEEIRTKYFHGRAILYFYLPKGHRNEALDRRAYGLAALEARAVPWETLITAAPKEAPIALVQTNVNDSTASSSPQSTRQRSALRARTARPIRFRFR
jgi:phage terminase large subunit GpA-like protein